MARFCEVNRAGVAKIFFYFEIDHYFILFVFIFLCVLLIVLFYMVITILTIMCYLICLVTGETSAHRINE